VLVQTTIANQLHSIETYSTLQYIACELARDEEYWVIQRVVVEACKTGVFAITQPFSDVMLEIMDGSNILAYGWS
jgi:hypothetical protein